MRVVLDVWENEPNISPELLDRVVLGTPHINGLQHGWGKPSAVKWFIGNFASSWDCLARMKAGQFLPEPPLTKLVFSSQAEEAWAVATAIRANYDVRVDNWKLKGKKNAGRRCVGPF